MYCILLIGIGFRTNVEGCRQLRGILSPDPIDVWSVDLPYFSGPEACLHLLSVISLVDHNLAVVYPPLLPVPLWQELRRRDFTLIEVPMPNIIICINGTMSFFNWKPPTSRKYLG